MFRVRTCGRSRDRFPLNRLRSGFRHVIRFLFPDACRCCGAPLSWPDAHPGPPPFLSDTLCPCCRKNIRFMPPSTCTRCGLPFLAGPDHVCGKCLETSPHFDTARSAVLFTGSVMDMVHRFKYNARTDMVRPLADLLVPLATGILPSDLLVPVPLHETRLMGRGYNQAALLAKRLAERLPESERPELRCDVLFRVTDTGSQTGLRPGGTQAKRAKRVRGPQCGRPQCLPHRRRAHHRGNGRQCRPRAQEGGGVFRNGFQCGPDSLMSNRGIRPSNLRGEKR